MPFDVLWLLVPVVVLFSVWMVYEHRRIDASKSTAYVVTAPTTAETMHEWMFGSLETTNGKNFRAYLCNRCSTPHVERREV